MVWTPFPESLVESIQNEMTGSWFDTIWKIFVLMLLVGFVYLLASLGIVGGVIAFIIIGAVARNWIKNVITDLWNRELWET